MARRRDKPGGGQVTPPRKRKKHRSGLLRPGNLHGTMNGSNIDLMDHGSTTNIGMSPPTAGSHTNVPPFGSRQIAIETLHRTVSGTLSASSHDGDQDSSFSEIADKILSPHSKSIEKIQSEYWQIRDECEKTIQEVKSHMMSAMIDNKQRTALHQHLLLAELHLAKAKLRRDLAISHETIRYGYQNTTDLPKLAITKGWLDEGIRRIETPTIVLNYESGYLFWELSHFFLATILTQHHDSTFVDRILPSVHEIVDIFQQTEPRSYTSGIGPFLELATGINTSDPLLMPEILRRLESRMATDTSYNHHHNPDTNSPREDQSQFRQQLAEPRAYRSPAYITTDDGIQHEIDPYVDSSPVGNSPAAYQHHYEDRFEEDVESLQDWTPVGNGRGLEENTVPPRELKLEEDDVMIDEQMDYAGGRVKGEELSTHEEPCNQEADPLPFLAIREGSNGLEAMQNNNRSLSVISDFPILDEVMQNGQDVQQIHDGFDERHTAATVPGASQAAAIVRRPTRFPIPDSFVMSDDEPEPDSNPFLAAHRVRIAASAAASEPNAPTSIASGVSSLSAPVASSSSAPVVSPSSAPVVSSTEVTRPTRPRKSEPIVLVSSPARSLTEQLCLTGQSTSQRQSSHIDDSMFISDDDSEDEPPPSSNPHLAALIRERASASTPTSAPGSGSNTPTSSASSNKTAKVKLPPHLARVRRAAHRTSLDPLSQLATPEELRVLDQEEYPLIDIIDEKIVDGEKKYLIKWKPIHGRRFLDTWEPAENANAASVEDWEIEKARRDKRKEPTKSKKARGKERERAERPVEKAAAEPATQESLPEDTPMFLADTAGDASRVSRGGRSVSALNTPSSSPGSSSDQVSSRTRSRLNIEDESLVISPEPTIQLTPDAASSRYASQPFSFNAVSPEPIANTAIEPVANTTPEPALASSTKVDNSNKYKTQKQQEGRMREKREIRRTEKAERMANMTEEKRAELEHSKKMQKRSKKERKQTKAERLAAMSKEERKELEDWLQWKKGVRARTKQDKKNRKANKAKKREEEARKQAQRAAKSS